MKFKETFDLLSVLAALLTTIGAFFLLRSIVSMGAKEISQMSGTFIGSNQYLQESYVVLRADTLTGFVLTMLGGIAAFSSTVMKLELIVDKTSLPYGLILITSLLLISHFISKIIIKKLSFKVKVISYASHVASYLENEALMFKSKKLVKDAKRIGLDKVIDSKLSDHENIAKILKLAGAGRDADHVLELET